MQLAKTSVPINVCLPKRKIVKHQKKIKHNLVLVLKNDEGNISFITMWNRDIEGM